MKLRHLALTALAVGLLAAGCNKAVSPATNNGSSMHEDSNSQGAAADNSMQKDTTPANNSGDAMMPKNSAPANNGDHMAPENSMAK